MDFYKRYASCKCYKYECEIDKLLLFDSNGRPTHWICLSLNLPDYPFPYCQHLHRCVHDYGVNT